MKVKFFAYIRNYTKCSETDIASSKDLKSLLEELCQIYGENLRCKLFEGENLSSEIIILVNGRHISHLEGIKTILKEEDTVSIFPVVAGG